MHRKTFSPTTVGVFADELLEYGGRPDRKTGFKRNGHFFVLVALLRHILSDIAALIRLNILIY